MVPKLYISRTPDGEGLPLPSYESKDHIALTLQAAVSAPVRLKPGERAYVPAGFAVGIPHGYCGQIVSVPLLARKEGIVVSDAPSVVHPANRKGLFILLRNTSEVDFVVHRGLVCAQLIIFPAVQVAWKEVEGAVSSEVTPTDEILLDEGVEEGERKSGLEFSSRRKVRPIRNRYGQDDEDDE